MKITKLTLPCSSKNEMLNAVGIIVQNTEFASGSHMKEKYKEGHRYLCIER